MAKKTKQTDSSTTEVEVQTSKLSKLIIKNFRCIGSTPVTIDLNEIVVLVGANNVGKSSILKAYEIIMSDNSKGIELEIEDYPNHEIDEDNLPEIELHLIVTSSGVSEKWLQPTDNPNEFLVRERWTWDIERKSKKVGWNVSIGDWDKDSYPFGPGGIANARRPEPHPVYAFSDPKVQADNITKLLKAFLTEKVNSLKPKEGEENEFTKVLAKIHEIQKWILTETKAQIDTVNSELTSLIEKIFPKHKVDFDVKTDSAIDPTAIFFKSDSQLLMGTDDHLSPIEKQGSGARRTLLWAALKYISENKPKATKAKEKELAEVSQPKSHLLLIDEPEICLHPTAIRDACHVLYELPKTGNWQVMVTTHSPIFIDFSRDNTTIVKVERNNAGIIEGTTVFRPDRAQLGEDDKKNLKLLNLCDPYVAEFFFGGKVIVVEGDTEYTAFNYIIESKPTLYKDIHIIRARGKATIVSLIKILNHFGSSYSVLHDSDRPKNKNGDGNPAWGNNPNILAAINSKPVGTKSRLIASLPNFEEAYFGEAISTEKPYSALTTISTDTKKFEIIEKLLQALTNHDKSLPENCTEWSSIDELEKSLNSVLTTK
ncbi:AAA family ATPase [Sediminibacterium sp.]|uniref:ATP-dependent nuclease n=1 Tax=Sediminibacterium sp. TaxID=1917865 RepID=UPI0025F4DDC8|nr:AAA family ATPase [Sediminibacterium sp.]MBW0176833.1 AAA family ATPase [Sediminibacterium sp.]